MFGFRSGKRGASAGEFGGRTHAFFHASLGGGDGVTGECQRLCRERDTALGRERFDISKRGRGEHLGAAHGKLAGGGIAIAARECEAFQALVSAFKRLAGLHGGFQTIDAAQRAGAGDVFRHHVERGIGPQSGLLDSGLGSPLVKPLGNQRGIIRVGASQGLGQRETDVRCGVRREAGSGGKTNDENERELGARHDRKRRRFADVERTCQHAGGRVHTHGRTKTDSRRNPFKRSKAPPAAKPCER